MDKNEKILNDFIARLEREKTKKDYHRDLEKFMNYVGKDLEEIDEEDCKAYMDDVKERIEHKKIALTTGEKVYSQLNSFFNYLRQYNYINCNHFEKIAKPTATRRISEEKIASWEELDQIISVLKTYHIRDYAICMIIFTSGLTLREATHLKWNQFFEDAASNIGIVFTTKRGKRYVKVHPDVWEILKDYRIQLGDKVNKDSYVFLNPQGKNISGRWIRMVLKKACKEARLSHEYTPRDLRHTLAAHSLKKGASSRQVKTQLGWSNENLAERYLYTIQQLDDNAIDYLNFTLKKSNT